jgi:septal ring factor EnvC (AmiA/AmiB activator)
MRVCVAGLLVVAAAGAILLAGCGGSSSADITKARLIAIENRKLTQKVQEQSQRIAELEAELENVKQESQALIDQVNKATGEILEPMILMQQQLQEENERLKKQLEQSPVNGQQ